VSRGSRVRKDYQPQRGDRHGRLPCTETSREDAKTRRRQGVVLLRDAGSSRGNADASRCRVDALPTPTALSPPAQGRPRNEDNPGFAPNARTNRIAVVATIEPNFEAHCSPTTSERNPCIRHLAQRRRGAEEDREREVWMPLGDSMSVIERTSFSAPLRPCASHCPSPNSMVTAEARIARTKSRTT
jgi:hypothetical protein